MGVSSVALVATGVIGYKLTHKGPPSFRRGGQFAIAGAPEGTTTTTAAVVESTVTTGPPAAVPGTAPATSSSTTATTARKAGTTTSTAGSRSTPTTRAGSGPAPTPTPTSPAKPVPQPTQPATPGKPAAGTYTWKVDGTEAASFVGSRRFPEKMTMVVHGGAGVEADQLVFDLTYSDKHAERQIVGFRNDGIYFDFEGGSVTFGPRTETSQADYEPPILEIPYPLQAGLSRTGVTQARGGQRQREPDRGLEGHRDRPGGRRGRRHHRQRLEGAGRPQVPPGHARQGYRNRTMWFDPARNLWVKFTEVFHGERHQAGFSFSYDSNATAVLASYTP